MIEDWPMFWPVRIVSLAELREMFPTEEKAMQTYIGIKRVEAIPCDEAQAFPDKKFDPSNRDPLGQGRSGYTVLYDDGYKSWSPAEAFEAAYTAMPDDMKPGEIADTLEVLRDSLEYLIAPEDRPVPDRSMPPPGFGMEFHNTAAERRQWAFEAAASLHTNGGSRTVADPDVVLALAVKIADFVEGRVTVSLTPVAEPS